MYEQLVQQKGNLAHAYVLSGDRDMSLGDLTKFLNEEMGIKTSGNPNYFERVYDRLGIDEVRSLGDSQLKTAVWNGNKIFVVSFNTVTVEAQNAMLKMVEEPTEGTMWFFLVLDYHLLLSTILSRVQLIRSVNNERYKTLTVEFMESNYGEREKIFSQWLGDSKKNISPDRTGVGQFIGELMSYVLEQKKDNFTNLYRELEQMQNVVTDRSSSVKYIMEYIAARLPQGK